MKHKCKDNLRYVALGIFICNSCKRFYRKLNNKLIRTKDQYLLAAATFDAQENPLHYHMELE